MTTIDALDAALLAALAEDPRRGPTELASRLGVSRNTVHARLSRLEASQILAGFSARLRLTALGLAVEAIVDVELSQGALQAVIDALADMPNVLEVMATTGRADLVVRVAARTHEELQALLQEILAMAGVTRTTTHIAMTNPVPYRVTPLLRHLTGSPVGDDRLNRRRG